MGDDDVVVRIITSSWDSISNECIGEASKLVLNSVVLCSKWEGSIFVILAADQTVAWLLLELDFMPTDQEILSSTRLSIILGGDKKVL